MNTFRKLRFPKTVLALFVIGVLVVIAIPVRMMLGEPVNLSSSKADYLETVFPILAIGLSSLMLSLLLWLMLRKKGFKFLDLVYPLSALGATVIFVYFHFTLFG